MSFRTDDTELLDDWLVAASRSSLPKRVRLLGHDVLLSRDADGLARSSLGEAQERYGYVWVCPSGRPARPLFEFPEYAEAGRRIVDCGGVGVHTSGLRVIENFLDMAHFPYVHPGYLGQVPHTEVADYHVGLNSRGEIEATECRFWQPRAAAAASDGIEARYRYRVMQPLSAMLYKTCPPCPDRMDVIALFVQPVEEDRCIAHCLLVYYDEENTDAQLIAFQQTIFGQDKPILENHEPRLLPLDGRTEAAMPADRTSLAYRRWLRERGVTYGVAP